METMKEYVFLSECWGGFISHFIDADLWHSFSDCHPNVRWNPGLYHELQIVILIWS